MERLEERVRRLEERARRVERQLRGWRLLACGLAAVWLCSSRFGAGDGIVARVNAEEAQGPAAPPGQRTAAAPTAGPTEVTFPKIKGKLTLIQDTTRPEPGAGPHGEALALVTDGRGIPFCFYERGADGKPCKHPSTFIGHGGDFNTSKWMTISNVHPPEGNNYYCIPPSNDPHMLGVWQDVQNCVQLRGRTEDEALTIIRDDDATYCMSIGNDGTIRWGSGKQVSKWPKEAGNRKVRTFLPDFLRYNPKARCLETNMEIRRVSK